MNEQTVVILKPRSTVKIWKHLSDQGIKMREFLLTKTIFGKILKMTKKGSIARNQAEPLT